jgi:SHS2 domain-containing protein
MKKFEILNHPADLKIRAFGKSLPELFANIAQAVAKQQKNKIDKKDKGEWEEIQIESADLESLLVDWLGEILYRSEINKKVYFDFEIMEFSENPYKIKARIKGVPVEAKDADIKAVTYHDLEVKKIGDNWETIVIFDI